MIYVITFPGEDENGEHWHMVYGTKIAAFDHARRAADELSEITGDKWKTRYISEKSDEWYDACDSKKTIVVEQRYSFRFLP